MALLAYLLLLLLAACGVCFAIGIVVTLIFFAGIKMGWW